MTSNGFSLTGSEIAQNFVPGQTILNRYTLRRILGQGGMGIVWLARDEELDLDVALKFLPSLVVNDRASLNDLKRETRRSLELTHPNIVRTYDFLQDSAVAGISMEYVDCDTLRNRRIDQPSGVFQPEGLRDWTVQLCDALNYAHHTASIVHRDLKPANLLISGRNHLKIADFGISRSLVESVTQVTGGNSVSGTLVYMSPQQLEGNVAHPLDDIYAVGATLYELCTSRPPFYSGDISRQVHLKVPPLMAARRAELSIPQGELPESWETTIAACLAKDPTQRPQSAGEIAVRLGLREAAAYPTSTATATTPGGLRPGGFGTDRGPGTVTSGPGTSPTGIPLTNFGLKPEATPPAKRKGLMPLAVGVIVLALAGAVWFVSARTGKPSGEQTGRSQNLAALDKPAKTLEEPPLASGRGGLFVESDPSGAIVRIDDRPAEKTPVPLKELSSGKHTLKMLFDGYEDFTAQVEVKGGQTVDTGKIKLVRSTGWISVTTNPAGAEITVSGPDASQTKTSFSSPWNSDKLPTGEYTISASRPGWEPVTKRVSLTRDQSLPVAFDLTGGSVQIDSVPAKATVLLDGKPVGTTPYILQDVPPGEVHYSLSSTGYVDATVQGKVERGQVLKLDGKLTKVADAKAAATHQTASTKSGSRSHRSNDDDDHPRSGGSSDKGDHSGPPAFLRWAPFIPHPHP